MKKTIYLITALVVCLPLISCKKFLETKSDSRLATPSSLSDLQGILDDAEKMNFTSTPGLGDCVSDDYFLPPATLASRDETSRALYLWQQFELRFANDWSAGYLAIYNANLCLELLEKIPRLPSNAAQWDNVKGSALFYRAYYFALLTMQYGKAYNVASSASDLGIALRLRSDFNVPSQRASVQACFDQVRDDAAEALGLLPPVAVNMVRPSKAAAYALLSRVCLYMGDYAGAAANADGALAIKPVPMDYNGDSDLLGLWVNVTFKKFNKETIFYTEKTTYQGVVSPSRARIDSVLYASYDSNDLRRSAFFRTVSGYMQFKGSYASNATIFFSGLATDEMYLNRAEGKAWEGDLAGAMSDLNILLKSRWKNTAVFVPVTAADKGEALARIRIERRKELLMRGIRFSDIKRLNREGAGITPKRLVEGKVYSLEPNSSYYALPLPADVIEQSGMQQN
jgi:hypothetical protein